MNAPINKYSQNVIINLDGKDWQIEKLKKRITRTSDNTTVKIINLTPDIIKKSLEDGKLDKAFKNALKDINNNSRIYIIGHGAPKDTRLGNAHFTEMSDFLALGLSPEQVNQGKDKLKISLIVCHAGVGDEILANQPLEEERIQSCAEKLHEHLGRMHNIKCELIARKKVVLLHPGTDVVGKKVMHLFTYGVLNALHQVGINTIGEMIYKNEEAFHKVAGSKISIKWDKNNHQYSIDSYLDKAYALAKDIFKQVKNDPVLLKDEMIKASIQKLSELLIKYPQLDYKDIHSMSLELETIRQKIQRGDSQYAQLGQRIRLFEKIAKSSINSDSEKFHYLDPQMTGKGAEMPTFSQTIKEQIYDPSLQMLGKIFPKTNEVKMELREKLSTFKNGSPEKENGARDRYGTVSILKQLGNISHLKMLAEYDYSSEYKISQQLAIALEVIGDQRIKKEKKKEILKKMQQDIESSRPSSYTIAREYEALCAWFDKADRHGYLTAVTWFRSILSSAKADQKVIDNLYDRVKDWFNQAMDDDILDISEGYLSELSVRESLNPKEIDSLGLI